MPIQDYIFNIQELDAYVQSVSEERRVESSKSIFLEWKAYDWGFYG